MTVAPPPPATCSARSIAVKCIFLLGLTIILLLAGGYAYRLVKQYDWLRTACMVAIIASGLAAAVCLAGIMHFIDDYLASLPPSPDAAPVPSSLTRLILMLLFLPLALAAAAICTTYAISLSSYWKFHPAPSTAINWIVAILISVNFVLGLAFLLSPVLLLRRPLRIVLFACTILPFLLSDCILIFFIDGNLPRVSLKLLAEIILPSVMLMIALCRQSTYYCYRWPMFHIKQLLLVAQILCTALALAAAGILLFNFKIP